MHSSYYGPIYMRFSEIAHCIYLCVFYFAYMMAKMLLDNEFFPKAFHMFDAHLCKFPTLHIFLILVGLWIKYDKKSVGKWCMPFS